MYINIPVPWILKLFLVRVRGGRDYIWPSRMRYDARCIYGIWAVDIANWVIIYFVTPFTKAWMIHWYTIGIGSVKGSLVTVFWPCYLTQFRKKHVICHNNTDKSCHLFYHNSLSNRIHRIGIFNRKLPFHHTPYTSWYHGWLLMVKIFHAGEHLHQSQKILSERASRGSMLVRLVILPSNLRNPYYKC